MAESADTDAQSSIERSVKPYRGEYPTYDRLPVQGVPRAEILRMMEAMRAREQDRWADGFASGSVYNGDPEHIAFLNEVYALNSQANPLHADLWPSTVKFEAEIVAMAARMLGDVDGVCGTVSSGGTESILLAMKVYRDRAYDAGIDAPEMITPSTAHAAFDKAADYFRIAKVTVPVGSDGRADVAATEAAITPNTAVIVGSAPCFPNGLVDPIAELAELAAHARHRLPHRRLPRRVRAAVGRAARLRRAAVRLPRAGRHLDVGRHAQVRLRGQGHVGRAVPRQGAAAPPVLPHREVGRAASTSRRRSRARDRVR